MARQQENFVGTDCILTEKVFDQCFKEDVIVRSFTVPTGPGQACAGVDLAQVDRVDCQVVSATCQVINVGPPLPPPAPPFNRIVTVQQDIVIEVCLVDETPLGDVVLCCFTETVTEFNSVVLYVPEPGALFGPAGGPFVFCEIVGSLCYCNLALSPIGVPVGNVICTIKVCKVIEVTAFVKLLVPTYGYCVPRPCLAAPQEEELICPPEDLFPPQQVIP